MHCVELDLKEVGVLLQALHGKPLQEGAGLRGKRLLQMAGLAATQELACSTTSEAQDDVIAAGLSSRHLAMCSMFVKQHSGLQSCAEHDGASYAPDEI